MIAFEFLVSVKLRCASIWWSDGKSPGVGWFVGTWQCVGVPRIAFVVP